MNIFKITEEEKRKILNSHKSALIVKEQANAFDRFKKEFLDGEAPEKKNSLAFLALLLGGFLFFRKN